MEQSKADNVKMSSIKILRIVTHLGVGGVAQHVTLLTRELNGGMFESKLVIGRINDGEGDMSFLADKQDGSLIQVADLCNGSGLVSDLKACFKLYRLIRRERPTVVHLHLLKARVFGGLAAKLARVPMIVETIHGNLFTEHYGRLKTAVILIIERVLGWLIMDRVIAISERQKQDLIRYRICPAKKA